MNPHFDEPAATDLAAELLMLAGGKMSYLKLLKLMNLVDRQSLIESGISVTQDTPYSMPRGPVLTRVYNLIKEQQPGEAPSPRTKSFWKRHLFRVGAYEIKVKEPLKARHTSQAQRDIIKKVFRRYGALTGFALIRVTHKLPEWEDPKSSSVRIETAAILKGAGKTKKQIATIIENIEHVREFRRLFAAK